MASKKNAKKSPGKSDSTPRTSPKSDAYTGLLVISLLALMGGSALLYLDYSSYEEKRPPRVPEISTGPVQPGAGGMPGGAGAQGGMGAQGGQPMGAQGGGMP